MESGGGADERTSDGGPPELDVSDGAVALPNPTDMVCHNGSCVSFSDATRANLILLLWPSTLPALGSPVPIWLDLSGKGNDAYALDPSALPTVIEDGVRLAADSPGGGFRVANNSSVDFAAEDFVVLVVAGVETSMPSTFFAKADGDRVNPRRITLDWSIFAPTGTTRPEARVNSTTVTAGSEIVLPVNVYAVRRTSGHVELRVNGAVWGSADLDDAQESTTNAQDIFIGVPSEDAFSVNTLQAVLALRGTFSNSDLEDIEMELRNAFLGAP